SHSPGTPAGAILRAEWAATPASRHTPRCRTWNASSPLPRPCVTLGTLHRFDRSIRQGLGFRLSPRFRENAHDRLRSRRAHLNPAIFPEVLDTVQKIALRVRKGPAQRLLERVRIVQLEIELAL